MNGQDKLESQLWDLVYELLSDSEAEALIARVTSEPAVARRYAEVKLQAELLAEAARVEEPVELAPPDPNADCRAPSAGVTPLAASLNTLLAVAASLLLVFAGWALFQPRSPLWSTTAAADEAELATQFVRTVLTAPGRWQKGIDGEVQVRTSSIDGTPLPHPVSYSLYDREGKLQTHDTIQTDHQGQGVIAIRGRYLNRDARLEVSTGPHAKPLRTQLEVDDVGLRTYVRLDRSLYQPGEIVRYRSLTLSRYDLSHQRDVAVAFEVEGPSGAVLAASRNTGLSERGVGNGQFALPPEVPGGKYVLHARSPSASFRDVQKPFFVRRYRTPRLNTDLELTRDSYAPGDQVLADFAAQRVEGGPVSLAAVSVHASVDGEAIVVPATKTDENGACRIQFQLPEKIEKGEGVLAVTVNDGGNQETATKTLPINLGKVHVAFFPEGGELVAGLPGRVYFHAYDPLGEPVHIKGDLVDSDGSHVATVETEYEGRGLVAFTPDAAETYQLNIVEPAGVEESSVLPPASLDAGLVMQTGNGVFEGGEPLRLDVFAREKDLPLGVVATCRGATVGHRQLKIDASQTQESIELPVSTAADGVIRLTVFDYSHSPPRALAERLVYRRADRDLRVRVDGNLRRTPRENVELDLQVLDENEQPVPSAVLGVTVVDAGLVNLADDKSPELETHFRLAENIERPDELEDMNFFLSDDPQAARALDLLLGTQGWRRFEQPQEKPVAELAQLKQGLDESLLREQQVETEESRVVAPMRYDNANEVAQAYLDSVQDHQQIRQRQVRSAGQWLVVGSAGVLVYAALLLLMRLSLARVWVPTLTAAVVGMLIGGSWIGAQIEGRRLVLGGLEHQKTPAVALAESTSESTRAVQWGMQQLEADPNVFYDANDFAAANVVARELNDVDQVAVINDFSRNALGLPHYALQPGQFGWQEVQLRFARPKAAMFGLQLDHDGDGNDDLERWYSIQRATTQTLSRSQRVEAERRYAFETLAKAAQREDFESVFELNERLKEITRRSQFQVRRFAHQVQPRKSGEQRSDFTNMLLWDPLLIADDQGQAKLQFALSDLTTTFDVRIDAHGSNRIGTSQAQVVSRIPFAVEPKLPLEVTAGDQILLPIAINNDSEEPREVALRVAVGAGLRMAVEDGDRNLELRASTRRREILPLEVVGSQGIETIRLVASGGGLEDAVAKELRIVETGFPYSESYAGSLQGKQQLQIPLSERVVDRSLQVTLQAFPSSLAELRQGVEGMLRQPSGCFEQTSSANYPNVMGLQFMESLQIAAPDFTRQAKEHLKTGYQRLLSFECKDRGYEWFGADPGHEALTAYGLLEFRDMSQVWDVDPQMIDRTARWLMSRRDGKGGFERSSQALDSFGKATRDVTNAYIVWALSESGEREIDTELDQVVEFALRDRDPYTLALAASAALNAGNRAEQADQLLVALHDKQHPDGYLEGDSTITRSGGHARRVETTALSILAWLKSQQPRQQAAAQKAIEWLIQSRQGNGTFGSTQATLLALKALVEHSKKNPRRAKAGSLTIQSNGKEIGKATFHSDRVDPIVIEGIAEHLKTGENELTMELSGDNQMPFVVDISYRTEQPNSSPACALKLKTQLASAKVEAGQTVGLDVTVENVSGEGQPMSLAVIGVPAGLEVRPEQLEELTKAGVFDYYELRGRELVFYWRSLGPQTNRRKPVQFRLDLLAAIPGTYTGPASRAYLYYTDEHKHWNEPLRIEIRP